MGPKQILAGCLQCTSHQPGKTCHGLMFFRGRLVCLQTRQQIPTYSKVKPITQMHVWRKRFKKQRVKTGKSVLFRCGYGEFKKISTPAWGYTLSCIDFCYALPWHRAGRNAILRMRNIFGQIAPLVKDGGRLRHVLDKGHKTKMHTYIQLCGTMGCYAVWAAAMQGDLQGRLPLPQALAVIGLWQAMGELWNHNISRCV